MGVYARGCEGGLENCDHSDHSDHIQLAVGLKGDRKNRPVPIIPGLRSFFKSLEYKRFIQFLWLLVNSWSVFFEVCQAIKMDNTFAAVAICTSERVFVYEFGKRRRDLPFAIAANFFNGLIHCRGIEY